MSKPQAPQPPSYQDYRADDAIGGILDSIVRLCLWGGLLGTVGGLGFLIYTYITFSGSAPASEAQALQNIEIFSKVLLVGVIALVIGTTLLWWGEETLGVLQLGGGAALYFAPMYLPSMFGGTSDNQATLAALDAIRGAGQIAGGLAVLIVVADVTTRIRVRAREGSRADQLKYGKGVKEERDIQNVFMGKCWQLPFCRKFVRDRCPIYHARRACWRERVGCMCEEEVIRGAMENRPIPKDAVLASKFIPRNNRLSERQKAERCRQCVIYNEHQKHKYKLVLPVTIIGFIGFYLLFRGPLLEATHTMVTKIDRIVAGATYREGSTLTLQTRIFEELLLGAFVIVAFAYAMKVLEFLIFKLKV